MLGYHRRYFKNNFISHISRFTAKVHACHCRYETSLPFKRRGVSLKCVCIYAHISQFIFCDLDLNLEPTTLMYEVYEVLISRTVQDTDILTTED